MPSDIEKTILSRQEHYDTYGNGVNTRATLMKVMKEAYYNKHGCNMPPREQEYLWDICNKLSRLAVCPTHKDSWHDVQGYAKLIEQDLEERYAD